MATETAISKEKISLSKTEKETHAKQTIGKADGLKDLQKRSKKECPKESDPLEKTRGATDSDTTSVVDHHPKDEAREASVECEINRSRQMLELLVSGEGNNIREAKLLMLFKRNRELKLALERKRISMSKLKLQLNVLQQELFRDKGDDVADSTREDLEKEAECQALEVKQWKDEFQQVCEKLAEAQASQSYLNMEVAKLQQALKREVGEHIPLSKVLDEGGKWRGRNQQISHLKDKVSQLKDKLEHSGLQEFHRIQIEAFDIARNKEYEKLLTEFLASRDELKKHHKKFETLLTRKILLETKELEIQAQAELINYLRVIASSQFDQGT
ncbi:hypothetical protein O6H91_14G069300 [Diphasiastrum complanatum]|uniref:Uncharacterized protein n=1 Tax=Diphasiastrum complanatum TaxID=34168 RepID=A0ACC2BQG2_DIPCM|nr:hypothetical protein O6H91_14G069300 [Diphasiastrum complanatum]